MKWYISIATSRDSIMMYYKTCLIYLYTLIYIIHRLFIQRRYILYILISFNNSSIAGASPFVYLHIFAYLSSVIFLSVYNKLNKIKYIIIIFFCVQCRSKIISEFDSPTIASISLVFRKEVVHHWRGRSRCPRWPPSRDVSSGLWRI